ncbi:hypothetical protein V1273_006317 [Bradyrhizobium sp. AZCC 1721]
MQALARIAKGDGCHRTRTPACPGREMDDPNDLVLAMLGLVIAAIMLVAGALYVINAPDPIPTHRPPPAVQVSPVS